MDSLNQDQVRSSEMLNQMKRVLSEVRQTSEPESVQDPALRIKPIELNRGQLLWGLNMFAKDASKHGALGRYR